MYPGAAPISLDTEYFSMYSDISILIKWCSSSNSSYAKLLATSVLPTPVGPKNINDPIGFSGSFIPLLDLIMASLINSSASFCPFTLLFRLFSRLKNSSAFLTPICVSVAVLAFSSTM